MPKIKILVLVLSLFVAVSGILAVPRASAVTEAGGTTVSPTTTSCQNLTGKELKACTDYCQSFTGADFTACMNCNSDSPDSTCVCHPEYKGGGALTTQELQSCQLCNQPGSNFNDYNANTKKCLQNNPITHDINIIVDILAGVASLVVIGVIIAGGIQYSMAGNPQAAQAARKRLFNAVIALAAFIFIWALLQWLIPGGI